MRKIVIALGLSIILLSSTVILNCGKYHIICQNMKKSVKIIYKPGLGFILARCCVDGTDANTGCDLLETLVECGWPDISACDIIGFDN